MRNYINYLWSACPWVIFWRNVFAGNMAELTCWYFNVSYHAGWTQSQRGRFVPALQVAVVSVTFHPSMVHPGDQHKKGIKWAVNQNGIQLTVYGLKVSQILFLTSLRLPTGLHTAWNRLSRIVTSPYLVTVLSVLHRLRSRLCPYHKHTKSRHFERYNYTRQAYLYWSQTWYSQFHPASMLQQK